MRDTASEPPGAVDRVSGWVTEPSNWLGVVSWLVVAFASLQILMFAFGRDQGIYAVVADGVVRGQMPYRDLWDFKPPGIYLIFAFAQVIVGKVMWGIRLLEVAGLVASVFWLSAFSRNVFGDSRPGLIGGAIAALIHAQLEFWHTAQPETFGGYLTIAALALTTADPPVRRKWVRWLGMGALFGGAFLLKPPLGGGALVCAAYLARREWLLGATRAQALRPVLVAAGGSLIPIALVAAWFWLRGAWGALAFTLFEFAPGYTALGWENASVPPMLYRALSDAFTGYSALIPAGVIAAVALFPLHSREREGLFLLLGVAALQLTGVTLQAKFFPYHYGATFPLLAALAGLGFFKLWQRFRRGGLGGLLAFLSLLYFLGAMKAATLGDVAGTFWQRSAARLQSLTSGEWFRAPEQLDARLYYVADYNLAADEQVAAYVNQNTQHGDFVLVWGFEPVIYWLSGRRPATKYIYNVPQRSTWDQARARRDFLREISETPPKIIVVQRRDVFPWVTGNHLDSAGSARAFPELSAQLDQSFVLKTRVEDFDIYVARTEQMTARPAPLSPIK